MNAKQKILYCMGAFVLFVGLYGFVPANAKVIQTASPTWNVRTPPPTPIGTPDIGELFPTVTATVNSSCGVGTPIGYGTLTPGLNWMLTCGQCLPEGTSTPTFDFNTVNGTNSAGTATVTPDGTGTATYTPTASNTPTPTSLPSGELFTVTDIEIGHTGYYLSGTEGGSFSCTADISDAVDYIKCDMEGYQNDNHGILNGTLVFSVEVAAVSPQVDPASFYYRITNNLFAAGTESFFGNWFLSGSSTLAEDTIPFSMSAPYQPMLARYTNNGPEDGELFIGDMVSSVTIEISSTALPEIVTPTPTPTATPAVDYCQSIDASEYDYESWFNLVGLTGSNECLFTPYISASDYFGSGWTAFFSFLFPDEVVDFIASAVIPAQTWCFYGVGFTNVQLFSIVVDPTIFADIAIVLFVLAHFLSK